jgi:phosphoribosylformylglycinamidine cyclo-ligase
MGHRFEFYLDPKDADKVVEISKRFGIDARIVGRIEPAPGEKKLTITSQYGTFEYC